MKRDHGGLPVAIDASVNVNPLGPPESLRSVFGRVGEIATRYPEIDAASARQAWAQALGVGVESLLVGNGASELISLVVRALSPARVIVFDPCYSEYEAAARAVGVPVAHTALGLEGDVWSTPLGDSEAGPGDLVVLGQPNNPTGHLTPPAAIAALAERGAHVLVDESFLALTSAHDTYSLASQHGERVSVVTSLTKTFCIPGLRLGLLVAAPALVARISEIRDPWSVNGIAAEAAVVLASESRYLERSRELIAVERPRLAAGLAALPGVRVTESEAAFVLAELPEGVAVAEIRDRLLAQGIGVRDASSFSGLSPRWLRLGVRTPAENDEVLAAIAAELFAELAG